MVWWYIILLVLLGQGIHGYIDQGGGHLQIGEEQNEFFIVSMSYTFGFPLSCDVNIQQTLVVNYTYGNFTEV